MIVLDSVGIGALPDAADFGDVGSDTLGHIIRDVPGFRLPNLAALGLGHCEPELGLPDMGLPRAAFGKAAERSPGKDTTTGHWEIGGIILETPFPTFPDGFPRSFMESFEGLIDRRTIGNYSASGTTIINELGDEHLASGKPIVYTSADSVFQIAMHQELIPIEEQYRICQIARDMLHGPELAVGRVIARPFIGNSGNYTRTANRRDFSLQPPGETVFSLAAAAGLPVRAVGKMNDIYAGHGITEYVKTANNMEGVDCTLDYMRDTRDGIILTNLVDFDMLYGHRRDPKGYANCLMEFDARIPEILGAMQSDDLLIITADHGNDPTFTGTDHTREYVPVLAYGHEIEARALGIRESFADMGATMAEALDLDATPMAGRSFWTGITGGES